MFRHFVALLIAGGCCSVSVTGQTQSGAIYVSVVDEGGRPVPGLRAQDFVVHSDGADRPVLGVRPATEPLSLVVIADDIDLASSQQARAALRAIITSVRAAAPDARVGLMVAEGAAVPAMLHVTEDVAAIERTVKRFVPSGSAAPLLESIIVAADTLGKESTGRRAVLVITRQGWADRSVAPRRIADALRESRAGLWAIEIVPAARPRAVGLEEQTVLDKVTRLSGGRRERIFDTISLEATAKRMADALLSQYLVTYAARPASGPGELRVGVRRDGVKVFAPGWAQRHP